MDAIMNVMTEKRDTLDPKFKQVMTTFLADLPVEIQTEVEVSRLPRTIDVLVLARTEDAIEQLRARTHFQTVRTHNQIEFKGQNDRLTAWNYLHILGRTYLYMSQQKVSVEEMSVMIVSAGKPRKVLQGALSPHKFTEVATGYYQNDGFPTVTIIVINELPITAENYPLLVFASSETKFRAFLSEMLRGQQFELVPLAYQVRPFVTKELLLMAQRYSIPKKNLEFIAKDIGEELMPFFSYEERLAGIPMEEVLANVPTEERLADIPAEKQIESLSDEAVQAFEAQIHEKTLWRLYEQKSSADSRIVYLADLPENDRPILLRNHARLLKDLDKVDAAKLQAWLTEQAD